MDQTRPIRLAFVDDHPSVTASLSAAADRAPDLQVVGTARTLAAALDRARRKGPDAPDVIVSDIQLAGEAEGFRLLDAVRLTGPSVILLSAFDQPPLLRTAFERGAAGYLVKTAEVETILDAVRTVAAGGTAFSGSMLRTIRSAPRRQLSLLLHPYRFFHDRTVQRERERLAAELHAGVLPGLYRSLHEVEAGGSVERLALDLREAVDEVEGILASRRSILLDETGLLGAIEWLAERTEERSSVTVEIDVENGTESGGATAARPPRKVERAAFRVAQLALDNCERHAPGCTVTIRLAVTQKRVALVVSDDGPGLAQTPADAARNGRSGLADMEDEARSCGARLTVSPADADPAAEHPGVAVTFEWRG